MKTYLLKNEEVTHNWHLVDVKDKILGRAATEVAKLLRGKHKPEFTPNVDCGDGVIVINAAHIKVTGKKLSEKLYDTYSGYPDGLRQRKLEEVLKVKPTFVFHEAVKGMLPKGPLGKKIIKKLKIYAGAEHKSAAQKPTEYKI